MKVAIILMDGVKQVNFTPESEADKIALAMFSKDDQVEVFKPHNGFGINIIELSNGYSRAYEDNTSLMLVIKPKPTESNIKELLPSRADEE